MRTSFFAICLGLVAVAFSQTVPPPNYRVVDGKLYDASRSVLWHRIIGKCEAVKTNGIILQTFVTNSIYRNYPAPPSQPGAYNPDAGPTRQLVSRSIEPDKALFVLNYPGAAEGQNLNFPAMQIGRTNIDERVLELWDCGSPYTNSVQLSIKLQ